jgi:hypothetical protein
MYGDNVEIGRFAITLYVKELHIFLLQAPEFEESGVEALSPRLTS